MSGTRADVAVVGAGIVGLAHALAAAKRGLKVVVFERSGWAVGASIRNFGLVWPVGQPGGHLYERALRSREIWREVAAALGIWCAEAGSLHLAYHEDELAVLEEYLETSPSARDAGCGLVSPDKVAEKSPAARTEGLRGALWSPTELNVDPRQAILAIATLLERDYGVELRFGTTVRAIGMPVVETSAGNWTVDRAFVCGGEDFETLYPGVFAESGITRCTLQMLRTAPQPGGWRLGPALCSGLTLLHYDAFEHCESLGELRRRFEDEMPFAREKGIHVLLSQTADGALTIGDSHDYGLTRDPFASEKVDREILGYLKTFASVPTLEVSEHWQGTYSHLEDGSEMISHPEPGVTLVNGLGGAGMTLSFGLAEENLGSLSSHEQARTPSASEAHGKILAALRAAEHLPYDGEAVGQLQHALQCADLARRSGHGPEVVVAALLHDIGRSPVALGDLRAAGVTGGEHGALAGVWLRPLVGERVAWLAEQHVPAKRYLVATDPSYGRSLSDTSRRTLEKQGGPMDQEEIAEFEGHPGWPDAAELRRWDDLAKDPDAGTPLLEDFEEDVWSVVLEHFGGLRLPRQSRIGGGIEDAQ